MAARGGPAVVRAARIVGEAWANVADPVGTLEEHLAALTESLDELCLSMGLEPPGDLIDTRRRLQIAREVRAS